LIYDNDEFEIEIDHTRPIKDSVFFMEDDFFHDIPLAKDQPVETPSTQDQETSNE
jgi:hypothetical protein